MKTIEINNGQQLQISSTLNGITVKGPNRLETYHDSEIVMALNLLQYMRSYGMDTAYTIDPETNEMTDFRIFQ